MSGDEREPFDPTPYIPTIDAILRVSDVERISAKKVRNALQALFEIDLTPYKREVDGAIVECFHNIQDELEAAAIKKEQPEKKYGKSGSARKSSAPDTKRPTSDAEYAAQLHRELNSVRSGGRMASIQRGAAVKKKKRSSDMDAGPTKKRREVNRNNPFNAKMLLSPQLADFLGVTELSRPEAVKSIWTYIKEHDLQNPEDKREILCDGKMRPVFGDKVHMFTMNKILGNHLYKRDEITGGEDMTNSNEASSVEDDHAQNMDELFGEA
ncbi:SWIB/MDM2 domain-containing protein [Lipomyces tetrasporus]|uniref:SWIB/MDM2 domain-containing protein n=1 Tax=Lipomyces tetrasporus TaxID=54092 RepID=A0AAD7QTP5_9ASCO|nr:SWIB/MDM2 domain-containing protein [Lipomyces tetrasporus]KAJ8101190.1 SWIB/MDM2 domain-containing protein [Lipomyces tetrasporus]